MSASRRAVDLGSRVFAPVSRHVTTVGAATALIIVATLGCGTPPETASANQSLEEFPDARYGGDKLLFKRMNIGAAASTAEIWKMNPSGRNKRQVTCGHPPTPRGADYQFTDILGPAWSPDRQEIIFYRLEVWAGPLPAPQGPRQYLYLIGANDDECGPGTFLTEGRFADWTPVGNRIVFDRGSMQARDVFVRDMDCAAPASCEVNLTNEPAARNTRASWSPDGSKIAFASAQGCEGTGEDDLDIWVMNEDGTDATRLTFNCLPPNGVGRGNNAPQWSPDGLKIVFQSTRDTDTASSRPDLEIYVMNADDGSEPTRLTDHRGRDANPKWSPDGEQIVFHRDVNAGIPPLQLQLFIMNANGSELTQVTGPQVTGGEDQTVSSFPAWAWHALPED